MAADISGVANNLINLFTGLVNKVILALIFLLIGFIIANIISRVIEKGLKELNVDNAIMKLAGIKISLEQIISKLVLYIIYFISIVTALNYLGIVPNIINAISYIVIILLAIFILLSIKDFIPNSIAGFSLIRKGRVKVGDNIEYKGTAGKIVEMTLVDVKLKTRKGDIIIIPNSLLVKNAFVKKKK
jgi:small-conductance mechanosensitive channel